MASRSRLVVPSERVHLVTREHGVVLVRPFLRCSLAIGLFGGGALEVSRAPVPEPLKWAAALLALLVVTTAMAGLIRRVGSWHARRLVITDRRAILVSGFLRRRVVSVSLDGIDDLSIRIPGLGRLLGYGRVDVTVSGRRGPLCGLRRLRDPDRVAALLLGVVEDAPRSARRRIADDVEAPEMALLQR